MQHLFGKDSSWVFYLLGFAQSILCCVWRELDQCQWDKLFLLLFCFLLMIAVYLWNPISPFRNEPLKDSLMSLSPPIHYSRHARCRMKCRRISEKDVQSVLERGTIDMTRTSTQFQPRFSVPYENGNCQDRYVLEGFVTNAENSDLRNPEIKTHPTEAQAFVQRFIQLARTDLLRRKRIRNETQSEPKRNPTIEDNDWCRKTSRVLLSPRNCSRKMEG